MRDVIGDEFIARGDVNGVEFLVRVWRVHDNKIMYLTRNISVINCRKKQTRS